MTGMLTVVYDACVLYPAPLRDLLMRLAVTDLFKARWSEDIHREWIENLLTNRPDLTRESLERTRSLMDRHVEGCLVIDYHALIEKLELPDPGDRHVLAAAIKAEASVIVTFNLKDFPDQDLSDFGVEAQHPDQFIVELLERNSEKVCDAAKRQRAGLKNPALTAERFLEKLAQQGLPRTVDYLREAIELL